MRIVLFKMEQESGVRQVLEARCVVGHGVSVPRKELGYVTVAVLALVIAGEAAEGCSCPDRGDRSFADTGDRRGVVREVLDGGVADIMSVSHEVDLR